MRRPLLLASAAAGVGATLVAPFDAKILLSLRDPANRSDPIGPWQAAQALLDATALGGFTVLTFVALVSALFCTRLGRPREAAAVPAAFLVATAVAEALKAAVARPRPHLAPHLAHSTGMSFPSGHALESAAVYFTLAVLVARAFPRLRAAVFAVALVLVLTIAASRVWLGVHWPSDALGGVSIGAALAAVSTRRR